MKRALSLLLLFGSALAFAQGEPRTMIRARLEPPGPVVVGQQVKLVVDVLVTTWFMRAPEYPSLKIAGAVVRFSDEQPPHLTEAINGEKWFGLSRYYLITPQTGGELAIAPFEVTLYPGQAKGAIKVRSHALKLSVKGAPGAARATSAGPGQIANMPATPHLRVDQRFDRKLTGLRVGDAFTRTIEIVADGTQAMFLPPTSFPAVKGLVSYPKAPDVENITKDRGGFVAARRTDAVTYVVQEPGDYELAAVKVDWWDTRASKQRTATIPVVKFNAVPNPGYKPEFALPTEPAAAPATSQMDWRRISIRCAGLVAALVAAWLSSPLVRRAWRSTLARRAQRKREYENSEAAAFAQLMVAAYGRDASHIAPLLYRWLDKIPVAAGRVTRAISAVRDPGFSQAADALLDRCYGTHAAATDSEALLRWLPAARRALVLETKKKASKARGLARALNP